MTGERSHHITDWTLWTALYRNTTRTHRSLVASTARLHHKSRTRPAWEGKRARPERTPRESAGNPLGGAAEFLLSRKSQSLPLPTTPPHPSQASNQKRRRHHPSRSRRARRNGDHQTLADQPARAGGDRPRWRRAACGASATTCRSWAGTCWTSPASCTRSSTQPTPTRRPPRPPTAAPAPAPPPRGPTDLRHHRRLR